MKDSTIVWGDVASIKEEPFLQSLEACHGRRNLNTSCEKLGQRRESQKKDQSKKSRRAEEYGFPPVNRHPDDATERIDPSWEEHSVGETGKMLEMVLFQEAKKQRREMVEVMLEFNNPEYLLLWCNAGGSRGSHSRHKKRWQKEPRITKATKFW